MKFKSTRGGVTDVTFEEAIFAGLEADGGLLVPESIPKITMDTFKSWATLSYKELTSKIVPLFVSEEEVPFDDLIGILDRAFQTFTHPEVVYLKKLSGGLNILELFHGPTLAFKDLALSCVGQFLDYFLERKQKHLTVLVDTSGDTGSAAIEAVRGSKWVDIVVILPKDRCSQIQELQMTTIIQDNVHLFRADGISDTVHEPVVKCFKDVPYAKKHNLCGINSTNVVRIIVQTVHFFYAYLQMHPSCEEELQIIVPTGACGNIAAGIIAQKMGLPVKLISATNENDIVYRMVANGDYSVRDCTVSLSSAMDIQEPYNVERMWYLFTDEDHKLIKNLMETFENPEDYGKVKVPEVISNKVLSSCRVDRASAIASMRRCWEENQYLVCPHTAVALACYYNLLVSNPTNQKKTVCIATASPAKFPEAVVEGGLSPLILDRLAALEKKPTRFTEMTKDDDWETMLRAKIEAISQKNQQ